jgi:hypothetical protein
MLLLIAAILAVLWLAGLLAGVGGGLIHIILVVAAVIFVYHMVAGRRHTV